MRYSIILISAVMFLSSCEETIVVTDLIRELRASDMIFEADGSSIIEVTAVLNKDADNDKRTVEFVTSSGSFKDGVNGKIQQKAELINGELIAKVILIAPMQPGEIKVNAQVLLNDLRDEYVSELTITATTSSPDKIDLSADGFSVLNNFQSEIELTGVLLNGTKKVSLETVVTLKDYFEDGTAVNGSFRNEMLESDINSKVRATYSPGQVTPDQFIIIQATVLDTNGNPTLLQDEIKIYVRSN